MIIIFIGAISIFVLGVCLFLKIVSLRVVKKDEPVAIWMVLLLLYICLLFYVIEYVVDLAMH